MKAQGISASWPGMNTPKSMQTNRISEPRKRHFERTYPFIAPSIVEIAVAGITIQSELKKFRRIPSQVPLMQ